MDRFTRIKWLFGEENFQKLQNSKVLLLGIGGVGGFCLDGLYRSGVQNIHAVDFDFFDITNQNRQIGSEALGMAKIKRFLELYPLISAEQSKIDLAWINAHKFETYDLIIDAIDDLEAKVSLALALQNKQNIQFISSLGGAKKLDPTRIKFASIWKTHGDPLARSFRNKLKKAGFDGDFEVVFSDENAYCEALGSFVGVTGSFGLALCSLAVKKLLQKS